jgi:hypothetical protein
VSSLQLDISELTRIYRSWHEQYRCRFGSTSVHITEIQKIWKPIRCSCLNPRVCLSSLQRYDFLMVPEVKLNRHIQSHNCKNQKPSIDPVQCKLIIKKESLNSCPSQTPYCIEQDQLDGICDYCRWQ